ncbi:SusD/RagB family nutrient-binding outer membrane lipoprotein [Gelidibacter salicanalis]|uniref:SusD/RagB family nutrient-binding outer membrane lipoprotein n=1 Tax=Gelidibacter salicanalis TaxID=291193 RepID=A0A934KIH5_9FLAO|nr:SusD/RagB family nutrient-binding outer membrane lipoprotein [Gelidibacter salicanalis]MBJ7879607.1 SusD/RagB family nutrient-binding outer membrane lipoprotein [Gelidibacter salicanalis]
MKSCKIKLIRTSIASLLLFSSCNYDDINQDPTRPGGANVEISAIVPAMQTQTHRNQAAALARHAGIIMQQWEGSDAQQLQYTAYQIGEDGPGSNTIWEFGFYTGAMRDADDIIKRATETGAFNTRGIAKIYMAINLGMATNVWGNVPYSEAFLGEENLLPKYDDQEEIYKTLQVLLSGAIEDLNAEDPAGIRGSLISGDNQKWIKAAHGLKARFYIQQTSVKNDAAQLALEESRMALSSNNDQLNFLFENTQNGGHPLALFGINRPNTLIISKSFSELMTNDPRKGIYMEENPGRDYLFYNSNNPSLFWAQLDSPSPVISYAEMKFIESESKVRLNEDGTKELKEAIKANMEFLSVPAGQIADYISNINLSGSTEEKIRIVIIEKYKALYGQNAIETWNDYRRTGYPEITPNVNGSNGNNPSGIVPRRLLYPISERLGNPDNYEQAINAQGGHLLDDDLWVFPKN